MERFGYLLTKEVELDNSCFPEKQICVNRIHPYFFKNLSDCIRHATGLDTVQEKEKRYYIKILKNSDVVRYIHNISGEYTCGYLYLFVKKEMDKDQISLFSHCNSLYNNMLDCVSSDKSFKEDSDCKSTKQYDHVIKIAYFVLLKDDILYQLHCPTCL